MIISFLKGTLFKTQKLNLKSNEMKTLVFCLSFLFCGSQLSFGQDHSHSRVIEFPDVDGYFTLKVDLHMHSVFSDGAVWPDIRVKEALKDGLDAISLTEHLEYQPHLDDIPHPDRNRAFEIALESAKDSDLLIIPGAEVTRDMPPGHSNAIFINDANRLLMDDARSVFEEVKNQGGFVFWDHPNWTAQRKDGVARLTDFHRALLADSLLSGIEVVNETTYSDEALEIALEHDLAIIGTSDIHGLIDWDYHPHDGGHRPVTLVFAEERSIASIHQALKDRRTAVWHNNNLIGKEENLKPLFESSLQVENASYEGDTQVLKVEFDNRSDASFVMLNKSEYRLHGNTDLITIPPGQSSILVKTLDVMEELEMEFEILNMLVAPKSHPRFTIDIQL